MRDARTAGCCEWGDTSLLLVECVLLGWVYADSCVLLKPGYDEVAYPGLGTNVSYGAGQFVVADGAKERGV